MRFSLPLPYTAHPRSRGEHPISAARALRIAGSSPLARGTSCHERGTRRGSRLIPARAGNMFFFGFLHTLLSAHPRSRGEHVAAPAPAAAAPGSSPLARGTSAAACRCNHPRRLIPARAGNILADMGFYPLHQQNRITLKPEPTSRIHDKQQLLTTTSTTIPTRLAPPRFRHNLTSHRTIN